ncbi:hypothetical protein J4526_01540 [Desulfurococcaceae archaeon MEX13E-LK6-19]|nr:hypothetical protein J4526_01540 [Desulfurococcaceae archaeon MEX13E-LK6-19]
MTCTEAEILRLLELIDDEVFENSKTLEEAKQKWRKLKAHLRELSLDDLRRELML